MVEPPRLITVRGNQLQIGGKTYRCAIGKGGFSNEKKEGDGATPIGLFPLRECLWRPDRMGEPKTGLPLVKIKEDDGWCADPESPAYNRPVKLPYDFSHELLWREDRRYDIVVPLGYNDSPVVAGKGSAIFMHVAAEDYSPTEGCVALSLPDLREVLAQCQKGTAVRISKN